MIYESIFDIEDSYLHSFYEQEIGVLLKHGEV